MDRCLRTLKTQIAEATGPSLALDTLIAETMSPAGAAGGAENYTSSVDTCLRLIESVLPGWHWHVGHGPTGILPYASLSTAARASEETSHRVEATAPTVPLALLHAATKALILSETLPGKT